MRGAPPWSDAGPVTARAARAPIARGPILGAALARVYGFISLIIVILNLISLGEPSPYQRFLASAIILLGALPTVTWLAWGGRGVPFMPALGAMYALYFGVPIFMRETFTRAITVARVIPDEFIDRALELSFLGMAFAYLGYMLGGALFRRLRERRTVWTTVNAPLLGGLVSLAGLTLYVASISREASTGIGGPLNLATSLAVLGGLILYSTWKLGRLSLGGWIYLWLILVPVRVLLGFGTGANLQGLELFISFGLAAAAVTRKLPWRAALGLILILIVLEPIKGAFREEVLRPNSRDYVNPFTASTDYLQTAQGVVEETSLSDAIQVFANRFGYTFTFAEVIEMTPEHIPYWGGETYESLFTKLAPRLLLPTKAIEDEGQEFGHRYSFIDKDDTSTSYNLAQLIEFYANFGVIGVLVGMALLGVVYRLFMRFLGATSGDVGSAIIGAYVLTTLLLIESNLTGVMGGAFYRLLFALLIGRAMQLIGGHQLSGATWGLGDRKGAGAEATTGA